MRNVLFSIRPEYAEKIFEGTKVYEYRKAEPKRNFDKIVIYETSPIMKVVGEAEIEFIRVGNPEIIWNITKAGSGIDKEFYDSYFSGKDTAIAFRLCNVRRYDTPRSLRDYGISKAPQSYCYIEGKDQKGR